MVDGHDSDREVLTSLPRSRPTRRSAKRADSPATPSNGVHAPSGTAAGTPDSAAAGDKADSRATGSRKAPRAGTAKAAARGGSSKAGTRGSRATSAGRTSATAAKGEREAASRPRGARARPTHARERTVPPAGYATPKRSAEEPPGAGAADVISTTIQATAELAQIGVAVGRQLLHSMFERLPKP